MEHPSIHGTSPASSAGPSPTRGARSRIWLAALLLLLLFSSVAQAQGTLWDQIERSAGEAAYPELVARYGGVARLPEEHTRWLNTIFHQVASQSQRAGTVQYSLTVLNSDLINAFALPGGFVFLTRGLLDLTAWDPDQLANVMGHEVAHIDQDHYRDRLARQLGITFFIALFFRQSGSDAQVVQQLVRLTADLIDRGWSREDEEESDRVGQRLAAQAGYDPAGMVRFLERLHQEEARQPGPQIGEWLRTHPLTEKRIAAARVLAEELRPIYERNRAERPQPPERVGVDLEESVYRDPLGRFLFPLPEDWRAGRVTTSGTTTVIGSRDGRIFFVHVDPLPRGVRNAEELAQQVIARYRREVPGFELERAPEASRLGSEQAAYFEYRYVDQDGRRLQEGSFAALWGDRAYLFQFADSPERFAATVADFYAAAEGFQYE